MAATRLWKSASAAEWTAAWARYPSVLASLQKDKLEELDAWFQTALPGVLHARDPKPFITQKELVQLMEWKLKKGKWRPALMKYIEILSEAAVQKASAKALRELAGGGKLKSAIEALAELKGVGPATASAVLAAYDNKAPFMGDEALEAIAHIIGARKYTLGHYMQFAVQLEEKAKWLNKNDDDTNVDDEEVKWTAQKVQLCLYAAAHDAAATPKKATAAASKLKAEVTKAAVPVKRSPKQQKKGTEEEVEPTRKRRRTATKR